MLRQLPPHPEVYTVGRYFVIYFKGKRVKSQILKPFLKDSYFGGFYIENVDDNGSRVIIETRQPFYPAYRFSSDNTSITVSAVMRRAEKKLEVAIKGYPVPQEIVATPFYVSSYVFKPSMAKKEVSYDETLFFMGVKFYTLKNYSYALGFFKQIIKQYPSSPYYVSSYFLLGDCYRQLKEYQKALQVYQKAIALSPKNATVAQTLFEMADIYRKIHFYSRARRIYQSIIKDYLNTKWADKAAYMLARTYFEQRHYSKALDVLMNIRKSSSYYPEAMLLAAEIFIKKKNPARAVLAYYTISSVMNRIDVKEHYRELIDVALALCRFEDYSSAAAIFDHIESSGDKRLVEYSYLGRMRCDLDKGDYDDLKKRANYILTTTRDKKLRQKVEKLLDEAKLKKGNVSEKTIEEILKKYANDPEVAALALFVYAKKNYNQKHYKKALDYLLRLQRLYPESIYNRQAAPMEQVIIKKLLDDLYQNPSRDKLDFIYSSVVHLKLYSLVDVCRIATALMAFGELDKMHSLLPYLKNSDCKDVLYAKYYTEQGESKKALEYLGNVESIPPYVYYYNIVLGDLNYFSGDYEKAVSFYERASQIKINLIKQYVLLRIMDAAYMAGDYKKSLNYAGSIDLQPFKLKASFIEAMDYYSLGNYKKAVELFEGLTSSLKYKEQALFYLAVSYVKMGKKEQALRYFKKLKKLYPESEYLKTLQVLLE